MVAARDTQGERQVRRVVLWIVAVLFLLLGVAGSALLILLVLESGLASILDVGRHIDRLMGGSTAPVNISSYTAHILSVIVITLTVAGLFITVLSLAAGAGLKTSIGQIVRELREELSDSVHDRVREMTTISHEGVRAQMATDRSVIEWRTHHAGLAESTERKRAVLRAYKNIEFASTEIDLALRRLEQSGAPDSAKEHTRLGLERLRRTILNNMAFYLAELYALGLLDDDSELVRYEVVPRREEAVKVARESADEALRHLRTDGESADFQRLRYQETRLFVRDRMESDSPVEERRHELNEIIREAETLSRNGERDLASWVADRRRAYAHLLCDSAD